MKARQKGQGGVEVILLILALVVIMIILARYLGCRPGYILDVMKVCP